jgi:hypothetical protein
MTILTVPAIHFRTQKPDLRALTSLDEPVAVLLVAVVHFIGDDGYADSRGRRAGGGPMLRVMARP